MSTTISYFRLFDLPLDLLELLTLYFKSEEIVKLLTVSSNFHEIFARSVWHTITRRAIDVAEPVRSSAYARYGHLVRSIDLFNKLNSAFDSHNWAQLFPNVTSMTFDVLSRMKNVDKQSFMDAIASLHGLRSLKIQMEINMPPFDLKTLATALVARHHDPSKQSLRELVIFFCVEEYEGEEEQEKLWTELSSFVQTLSPLRPPINLQIDMSNYYSINAPTPAQMDILRPYLTVLPNFSIVEDGDECVALHNRQIFSPSGTRDDPLVFGRLGTLRLAICCTSPLLFDYSDFTPVKFPVMKWIDVNEINCIHDTEQGAGSAVLRMLLQRWPKVEDLRAYNRRLALDTLDTVVKLNPQLVSLDAGMHHNTVDINGVLMLERVAGQLPQLTRFTLYGISSMLVDSDWLQATSLVDIRSSKLESISISNTMLKPRLFEVLFALPKLRSMSFEKCVLIEPELFKSVFKKHQLSARENITVGISSLTIGAPRANISWPAELLLELIACLSHLKSCTIYGDYTLRNAIKEKHPHFF